MDLQSLILPSDRTKISYMKKLKSQSEMEKKISREGREEKAEEIRGSNVDFQRLNSFYHLLQCFQRKSVD